MLFFLIALFLSITLFYLLFLKGETKICLLSQVTLAGFLVGIGRYCHMMPYIETYVDLF